MAAEQNEQQAPGPRGFWSGTITFGLVSVPVDLYPAVRSRRAPLRMLGPEGQPLSRRYYGAAADKPLANDDIVRGYEWEDGSFTVVSDEELDAVAPRKSRDIDLRRFVQRSEIPTELLERSYVLAPAGDSTKAYHLLAETMERSGRAGIATFVMRGKEYLAAIFAEGGSLRATTMRFVDELRTPQDVGLPPVPQSVSAKLRKSMETALAKLEKDDLDEDLLEDEYTTNLLELAEKKRAASKDVVEIEDEPAQDDEDTADIIDIMSVLRERMGAARAPARATSSAKREPKAKAKAAASKEPSAKAARAPAKSGDLAGKSKQQLYTQAKKLDVPNRSAMSKEELIEAIRAAS